MRSGHTRPQFEFVSKVPKVQVADNLGPKISKNLIIMVSTKCVNTSGTFLDLFSKKCQKSFKQCSHIELNTTNPNPIFKVTIYCTKHTNNAKIHSKFWKNRKLSNTSHFYFTIYINFITPILYFLYILKLLYVCIYFFCSPHTFFVYIYVSIEGYVAFSESRRW